MQISLIIIRETNLILGLIGQKRMILVLLSKLGIPIVSGIKNSFDIDNVEFDKNQIISLIELHNIKK